MKDMKKDIAEMKRGLKLMFSYGIMDEYVMNGYVDAIEEMKKEYGR